MALAGYIYELLVGGLARAVFALTWGVLWVF